jgi:hypothetical protein
MVGFMACANNGLPILLGIRSDAVLRKLDRAVLKLEISPRFMELFIGLEMELDRILGSLDRGEGVFVLADVFADDEGEYSSSSCRLADKNGSYRSNKPLKRNLKKKT